MAKKALLVNDSKFESLILKDMLSKLNYDVEIADEFDALYTLDQFEPDLVIVNYIMQKTRGDILIALVKAGMPDVKCLLSSSSAVKLSQFQGQKIDGILHTPISMFILKDTLSRIGEFEYTFTETKAEAAPSPSSVSQVSRVQDIPDGRYCDHCNNDLSNFNASIMFCPFCGEAIL